MPFVVTNPVTAEQYLRSVWDKDTLELREEFVLVCVNTAHEVLGWVKLATGGIDAAAVDPRLVFGVSLQVAAAAIVIAHNHPSGSVTPSIEDREFTYRLKAGADLLDIRLLDHLILGRDKSFSFSQAGLLTP
jgi:DNA repair protein RadC